MRQSLFDVEPGREHGLSQRIALATIVAIVALVLALVALAVVLAQ